MPDDVPNVVKVVIVVLLLCFVDVIELENGVELWESTVFVLLLLLLGVGVTEVSVR